MLRIGFVFFGANETAPFVAWVYTTSEPLLRPFQNMFPTEKTTDGFVVEISSLFALLAYMFLAFFAQEILENFSELLGRKSKKESVKNE